MEREGELAQRIASGGMDAGRSCGDRFGRVRERFADAAAEDEDTDGDEAAG